MTGRLDNDNDGQELAPDVMLPGDGPGSATRRAFVEDASFEFSPGSLVGSWFHRLENDVMVWQGVIVAEPQAGVYLAEIDTLGPGTRNVQRMLTIQALTVDEEGYEFRFYDSEPAAKSAYAMWVASERERV